MAINVTVTGSPISVRGRSKMVLSDLENLKKTEREHRRRLRLEQVNEQTKAFSRRVLERAKRIEQEELSRLQNEDSKIKRAHNKRLAEYHRRLQDIENIGYAHENAAKQPDIEMIKQAEEERNKALARARGADAIQRLQETNKVVSPHSKQQERLQAVRDFENERSRMVAQLPKKTTIENESIQFSENDSISKSAPLPTSKKRPKCVIHKKTPVRKLSKQKSRSSTTKSPSRVSVAVDSEELNKIPSASTSSSRKKENESLNKPCNVPTTISGQSLCNINQEQKRVQICESDDNEPRKIVPSSSEKPEKIPNCHHDNSSCSDLSSTSVSSSSVSESSCFSGNTSKVTAIRKTPRYVTPVDSKIQLYDHKTRQRNVYDTPSGLVQRLNIKNQPNAEDLAREITELENRELATLASQQDNSKQRSKDAMLRDKIKRDYEALLKNLDLLTKEERRIKASQVASAANKPIPVPSKKREDDAKRQKKMDRAFQNILRSSQKPNSYNSQTERPITITPRDYLHEPTPSNARRDQNSSDDQVNGEICSEEDENYNAHKGMVCDLLLKIEKLKKILLQEYGADLPDTVFNASVKSLFNQTAESSDRRNSGSNGIKSKTPEIQVINMSGNEEAHKSVRKFTATNNNKNKKGRPPTPGKALPKTSTASTSTNTGSSGSSNLNMRDQQVQVELTEKEKSKEEEKPRHPIEPVVTVITPENADSNSSISSTNSSSTDVLIDVSKKSITVVPKESCRKISKEASATPAMKVSNSTSKTPVKISFEPANGNSSFQVGGLIIDAEKKEITVLTKKRKTSKSSTRTESPAHSERSHSLPGSRSNSPVAPLPKSAPSSRQSSPKKSHPQTVAPPQPSSANTAGRTPNQQKRYRSQITQVTIDSSTESSQLNSTSDASNSALYTRYTAMSQSFSKVPDTSDASTTYRSPPAAVAGSLLHAMGGSTPILELLDCSSNESLRRRAREVSPVSSPETPSPRTVLLPSNRPKPGMPSRRLKFTSLLGNKQVKQTDRRGAGDPKVTGIKEVPRRDMYALAFSSTQNSTVMTKTNSQTQTSRTCTCSDPGCRLLHEKIEDTQAYALKHWPEIVKKYEDLQNVCSERIVSLTDLIQKVRNEQRGLELSVVSNEESKSNSTSQVMPTSQSSSVGGNVSKLVKNIDSIHARLKRTLVESQKIIAGGEGMEMISTPYASFRETEKSPSSSVDLSKISSIESLEEYIDKSCKKSPLAGVAVVTVASAKPKIVKDERVNIPLNRFRLGKDSRLSGGAGQTENTTTAEAPSKPIIDPAPSVTDQSEVLVEMLSKEILEQSKSINKSVPPDSLKDSDDSILKTSQAHVTKDSTEANKNANSNDDNNQSENLETSHSDYVPFLAGIPKIPRSLAKSASNSRTRPPVTLISGPYRAETLVSSPMHELSTIVEFDTPDTANKSQVSTKSPSNKCRKKLVNPDTNSNASSPSKRDLKATKSKPSVQVAPLPAHRSPQFPHNILNKSTTKNTEKSPKKSINKSLESLERRKTLLDNSNKSESSESMHSLPDMHIEHLQQSHDNGDSNYEFCISQFSEMQSLPDENIDQMIISEICEESKSKTITPVRKLSSEQELDRGPLLSTSSASFSGLSGVSEITTTPSSDLNLFKCPSSPEEMELALKKWGLGWAIPTLKKTREASALGSSSSSDVTPVNTVARLVSPAKKHHDCTPRDLPEISDVSSISIKHTNKSTEKSVLVRGRTSTPNRLIDNSNNNSHNYSDNQSNNYSNNRSNVHSNNDSDNSNDRSNHSNDHSNHSNDHSNGHSNHSNDRSNPSNNRSINSNNPSNPSNDRSNHSNNRSNHLNNRLKPLNDHSNHSNDHLKISSDIHSNIPSSLHSNIPSNIISNIPLNLHSDTPLNLYTNTPLNVYSNTPLNAHSDTPLNVQSNTSLNVHPNIVSTDDPNIPSKDHANVLTNVNPIISSIDHGDTHSTVRPSIRSNIRSSINSTYRSNDSNDHPNIPISIPSNISSSVHPSIPSNIPSNVSSNIHPNIPSFFSSSIHPNIPTSMSSNVSSNIHTNIPSSMPSNVSSNIHTNIPSSIPSNVSSNILPYIPSSMPSNVSSNIHANIPSSIPSSIPSNVSSNVHPDIPSSIPITVSSNILSNIPSSHSNILSNIPSRHSNILSNIPSNIHPNIPSNVPSNVHLNDQINIPANNDSNDYSNNYPNYRLSDHRNNQTNNHTYHSNDYPNYRLSDYQNNPNNPSNNRSNNNLNDHSNNYSSDGTISTLGSFSSDFNIVLPNQSSDISIPNISFTNKLG